MRKTRKIEAEIVDMLPTILQLMGVAQPQVDGRVVKELFLKNGKVLKRVKAAVEAVDIGEIEI